MGIKVLALGVPTVVGASTIVADTLTKYMENSGFSEEDIDKFISEVNGQQMENMFVTPKNIDESIKRISFTVSEALNTCFSQPA